jgi:hypothetical protein
VRVFYIAKYTFKLTENHDGTFAVVKVPIVNPVRRSMEMPQPDALIFSRKIAAMGGQSKVMRWKTNQGMYGEWVLVEDSNKPDKEKRNG